MLNRLPVIAWDRVPWLSFPAHMTGDSGVALVSSMIQKYYQVVRRSEFAKWRDHTGGIRYFSVSFGSIVHANVPDITAVDRVQVPPGTEAPVVYFAWGGGGAVLCHF